MDPIVPPDKPSNPVEDGSSSFSLRRMWQVPLFFVGVVAVITACLSRGLVAPDPVRELHHKLAETRRLLDGQDRDPEAALQYAKQAVKDLMYDQGRGAEAFFLLGSAHLRVADHADQAEAEEHWHEAQRCFQEAERRGLAGEDANRLNYRLAKLQFHLSDNPAHVIEQLKTYLDDSDDRAEALTLIYQSYLRMKPPNLKEALKVNRELREKVPQLGEDVLGPAKLAGAKLLIQLGQRDEARKTLEKIREQAPPATLSEKNMLLAGLYQEERKWAEAAVLWRAVLDEKRAPLTEAGGVLYNLGVCCRQLEQYGPAAEAWSDCMKRSQGEEGQAAALALAELRLHEANPEKGVAMLAEAVAKVRKAEDWKNSLMDLADVQKLFEQAMTIYREAKRFDLAVRTAELYERVAVPPRAQVRRAELNSEWAHAVQKRAASAKDEAARKKEESTADALLRQAAEAHTEAAKLLSDKDACQEHLWRSAVCSYEGHDYPRAAEKLKDLVQNIKDNADRLSEALFLLGETCRNLNNIEAAETAYKACVERGARFTYRARYQLAMIEIEAGRIDSAVLELEQNILIEHRDADPEAQEKSRLALCSLLYQGAASLPQPQQNYRRVLHYLKGHIDRIAVTPEAVRARYQLADSYRQLASNNQITYSARVLGETTTPEGERHHREQNRDYWTCAAKEYVKLEELIKTPELATLLSLKQQVEIPFYIADCYFNLGEYEKALHKYEGLAEKWGQSQLALRAMSETMRCYAVMNNFQQIQQRAEILREMLTTTEGLTEADRQQWLAWLKIVTTPPQSSSRNDEPRIINEHRDEPRILNNQDGPLINPGRNDSSEPRP